DDIVIDALIAPETRPRVASIGAGMLLTLRGVNLNPGAEPDDMVSLRIWVDGTRLISVRLRRLKAISDITESLEAGNGPKDIGALVAVIASRLAQRISPVIEQMDDDINALEQEVLTRAEIGMRHRLVELRGAAITLRRYMSPQRDALNRLSQDDATWIGATHRIMLRECVDQMARIVEDLDAIRERAAVVQDELNNRITEKINRNMYTLSVVAALMLPLGVIAGVLGMNVGGIPFADSKMGFWMVVAILAGVVVMQVVIFRKLKWI
ncbi:MAG: zinc transporter ZntB, partial [Proteobacteria bacterium]|nr:zinc transporter ZntB [Pseudomonadota bacterium]